MEINNAMKVQDYVSRMYFCFIKERKIIYENEEYNFNVPSPSVTPIQVTHPGKTHQTVKVTTCTFLVFYDKT
jgi:hypothetical protein